MDDQIINERLETLHQQDYPLVLTSEDAEALVECISRIMAAVPEDERIFVRADYDLASSALWHPGPSLSESDERPHFLDH